MTDKLTLSRVTAFADTAVLRELAAAAIGGRTVAIVKKPEKTMILLDVREPVRKSEFYLGEALAAHCVVEVGGARGAAVQMGDDLKKCEFSAILDAAHTAKFPEFAVIEPKLLELDAARLKSLSNDAALVKTTQVRFNILEDREIGG
jgi:alpha-D-ribose 1-methylphosphonate 5-triphosphate synthase subunit PhnG